MKRVVEFKNGTKLYPYRLMVVAIILGLICCAMCFIKYDKKKETMWAFPLDIEFVDPVTQGDYEKQARQEKADRAAQDKAKKEGDDNYKDRKGTLTEDVG